MSLVGSFPASYHYSNHHPTSGLSRKRSQQLAFDSSSSSSPCLSTRRTIKRIRSRTPLEQPSWVSNRDNSVRVDGRIGPAVVDVLGVNGESSTMSGMSVIRGGDEGESPGNSETWMFTVLCFLGTEAATTLSVVAEIRDLLAKMGARAVGVALERARAESLIGVGVEIVHDKSRVLTTALRLVHPLGGGSIALDAVVVLDARSWARIVMPIGWGIRGVDDVGNRWENLIGRVIKGIEWLRSEAQLDEGGMDAEMQM